MKIRSGFVSNSSSSSFVAHAGIVDVCKNMLKTICEDLAEWDGKKKANVENKRLKVNLSKALRMKEVKSGEIGIKLPSCNYDTYVIQGDKKCYVDTCRNHVWDFDFPTSDHQGDDYNVMVTSVQSGKKFVDIQNGKLCESDQLPI